MVGPGARVSAIHRTISEYGLISIAPFFITGVVVGAVGLVLVSVAALWLGRAEISRPTLAGLATATAAIGLVLVALFDKTDWTVGDTPAGMIHRAGSLMTFLALPVALIAITWRRWSNNRLLGWACVLAAVAPVWLAPIVVVVVASGGAVAWWQVVPLGIVERGMVLTEAAALLLIALDAVRRTRAGSSLPTAPARVDQKT